MFIVIDGMNGAGKTSVMLELETIYRDHKDIVFTEDPGGTSLGMELKRMMSDRANMSPYTRLHMHCAARQELCERIIQPAINEKKLVICDRYYSSNFVYQGKAAGIYHGLVQQAVFSTNPIRPNLFIILDVHSEMAIQRINKRGQLGERGIPQKQHIAADVNPNLSYFKRVRKGFKQFAKLENANGGQALIINAGFPLSSVVKTIQAAIEPFVDQMTKK